MAEVNILPLVFCQEGVARLFERVDAFFAFEFVLADGDAFAGVKVLDDMRAGQIADLGTYSRIKIYTNQRTVP